MKGRKEKRGRRKREKEKRKKGRLSGAPPLIF
jgi:hypothetical protein